MTSGHDLLEYDSIEDLEDTIEEVYSNAKRLNGEMKVLTDQIQEFLNYSHSPEMLEASVRYVDENIPDESHPEIVDRHARKQLENPEEAENWDRLQEAIELTGGMEEQYVETYESLWNEFGYNSDEADERIGGQFALEAVFRAWENQPHILFQDQEEYEEVDTSGDEVLGDKVSGPTMVRYFDIERNRTSKQRDDIKRGEELERQLDQDRGRALTNEDTHNFWRNQFMNEHDPEDTPSEARWVNRELMNRKNELGKKPTLFQE